MQMIDITVSLLFPGEEHSKSASLLGDKKTLIMYLLCRRILEYKRLIKPFLKLQQFSLFFSSFGVETQSKTLFLA